MTILPFLLLLAVELPHPGADARQPQLAAAQGQVALTYGSGNTIYFARSTDGGKSFAPAVKVADTASLMLGRHRGPRVAILSNAVVITAVAGADHELLAWRSTDRGKTWSAATRINDVPKAANEGLHAMTVDARDNLLVVWLDLRGRAKGKRLEGSRSIDGGRTWSKNFEIYASPDGTICECCDPSLAADANGGVWAMWRNAVGGSRDLYAARAPDGEHFGPAQKLGEGTWKLDACPMDGGAIAVDRGRVVSAWRREGDVFLASPGKPESRLGEGKDVAMALGAKGAYVAWVTGKNLIIHLPGAEKVTNISNDGAYPDLVALPDGAVLAAWEERGTIRVERLP